MLKIRQWRYALHSVAVAALAILMIAGTASAQGGGRGQGRRFGGGGAGGPAILRDSIPARGPIDLLLARRDSLALNDEQVSQLQRIGAELQQLNAPHVRSMLELRRELQPLIGTHPRDMTSEQRARFQKQAERARPVMEQVHENNRRAMERVSKLLSPEQKRRVREWLQGSRMMGTTLLEP